MFGVGAAGLNILRIGVLSYSAYLTLWNVFLSALVFAVFQWLVFGKLVKKHTARISAYGEERHFFWKFFDAKAFVIMAVMMTGGVRRRAGKDGRTFLFGAACLTTVIVSKGRMIRDSWHGHTLLWVSLALILIQTRCIRGGERTGYKTF